VTAPITSADVTETAVKNPVSDPVTDPVTGEQSATPITPKMITPSPAQGRAMLTWEGKQPPAPVSVPDVRLVEVVDPHAQLPLLWLMPHPTLLPEVSAQPGPNLLYYGDNQAVLAHLLSQGWGGKVKLIYIDPPFDSGGDYARKVRLRHDQPHLLGETVQYRDTWRGDSYLQFIYERLFLLRDLLAEDGCIWLHCDYRQSHRLRLLLEEVFGEQNYLNTIAWRSQVARGAKVDAFFFPYSTHYLEVFAKNRTAPTLWQPQKKRLVFTRAEAAARFMNDPQGFFRTSDPGTYSFAKLKELHAAGRLYAPYGGEIVIDEATQRVSCSNGGNVGIKYYLTRLGSNRFAAERGVDNLWEDIPGLGTTPGEDVGYPTQKTEALLKRVIHSCTRPGDLVLDCFLGSGTTAAVAHKMGRRWIGCDIGYGAVQTARRRLQRIVQERGPGFALYHLLDPLASEVGEQATTATPGSKATVTLVCKRLDAQTAQVEVLDYQTSSHTGMRRRPRAHVASDWRALVDAIDIDPAYNGTVLRPLVMDLPTKRRAVVQGRYLVQVTDAPTQIAVRVMDIFGQEQVVVQTV
jgi:DNA modification methylase